MVIQIIQRQARMLEKPLELIFDFYLGIGSTLTLQAQLFLTLNFEFLFGKQ